MHQTLIDKLNINVLQKIHEPICDYDIDEVVLDLSMSIDIRNKYIAIFYELNGYDLTQEIINKLSMMYQLSGTNLLQEYLYNIATKVLIHIDFKIIAAQSLCSFENNDYGYEAIDHICVQSDFLSIPTPRQINLLYTLMKNKKFKKQAKNHFCKIINNINIDIDFRYKSILGLENISENNIYFLKEICLEFITFIKNTTRYRILAGQCLLRKCKLPKQKISKVEKILLSFAQDNTLDHILRSDASDVLLQLGTDVSKKIAKDIIACLGKEQGIVRSIFDNTQNVHSEDIDSSLYLGLEFLSQINTYQIERTEINFEYIKKHIEQHIETNKIEKELHEKITISLNRIFLDRAIYGPYNMSLRFILIKVFSYIKLQPETVYDEIFKCLIEELIAMSGWCSSGYATRLLNSISGFGDFNYSISWKEQIISNFVGRLNACIRNIKDEDLKDKILEELIVNSSNYIERQNFLAFFRQNVFKIREEMYQEFKQHVDDSSFDLSFRSAILTYEN